MEHLLKQRPLVAFGVKKLFVGFSEGFQKEFGIVHR
jgi:hypothetical protein